MSMRPIIYPTFLINSNASYYADIDSTGAIKVTGSITATASNRSSFNSGKIVVTTAGTAVQGPNVSVASGFPIKLIVHSKLNNGSDFSSYNSVMYLKNTSTGANDCPIMPEQSPILLYVNNLNVIYVDADENNMVMKWIVET